jgi:sporulation protein YlmC with PRC-barrel domain
VKKPDDPLELVSQVRDLQIVDSEGRRCGIADDVEFDGKPGGPLKISAIMVGPGAWAGRLPGWALALAARIAGRRVVRVPWARVRSIGSTIALSATAAELGLGVAERKAERLVPKGGAL